MNEPKEDILAVPVGRDDHVLGPADAPVTLVGYSDYECPYCRSAYLVLRKLRPRLGDRVRYVFRNFPLEEVHPHARSAAEAAEAAASQGRFWEMHDRLFEHQRALGDADFLRHAAELRLDVARFEGEMEEHTHAGKVEADFVGGLESGVRATPLLRERTPPLGLLPNGEPPGGDRSRRSVRETGTCRRAVARTRENTDAPAVMAPPALTLYP